MLRNLIIFSLCVVAIKATGEFTVLSSPKSLSFKGNEPLQSSDIGDVLYASMGNAVAGDCQWSGLTINDPFNLAKGVVAIFLDGIKHSKVSSAGKTYPVAGNAVEQSLNGVIAQLEADNEPVCDISFEQLEDGKVSFRNTIGNVEIPAIANTKYLNADLHTADKQFLESLAYVNAIANNLVSMEKSCNFISIRLYIDAIAKAHGEDSEAVNEALELFSTAVKHLNNAAQKSSNNEALVAVVVNKADGNSRSKREVAPKDSKNLYNLAEYYNQDYPVIFNIILWFMVVFGFSLLAICYAIGSMDPGRDSIIYRMTSTRMKKDN
ncbi:ATPase H(+)-transporting accessory protein 2 [Cochliomyia hominivorax]